MRTAVLLCDARRQREFERKNMFCTRAQILLDKITPGEVFDDWLELQTGKGISEASGEVHVQILIAPVLLELRQAPVDSTQGSGSALGQGNHADEKSAADDHVGDKSMAGGGDRETTKFPPILEPGTATTPSPPSVPVN